jgi:hypothetical protein
MFTNNIILTNNVRDTKYHKWCSTFCLLIPTSHKGEQQFFGELASQVHTWACSASLVSKCATTLDTSHEVIMM